MADWDIIQSELKNYVKNIKKVDIRMPIPSDPTRLYYLDVQEIFNECPTFKDYFVKFGLDHSNFVIIKYSFPSGFQHVPHLDNASYYNLSGPPEHSHTKWCLGLNFPIDNCENTYTCFYKTIDNKINISKIIERPDKPHYGVYRELDRSNLIEIDRYSLTKPILINTSVPHNVINNTPLTRTAITVRLSPDPWHLIGQ